MRKFELKRYIAMCALGGVSMVLQLVVFNILRLSLGPETSNIIGVECAILLNFLLNNRITFHDRGLSREDVLKKWFMKFMQFNAFSLGSLLIQLVVITVGVHCLARGVWVENGLVVLGIFLGSIYNYFVYAHVIWKKKND